jgi:putative two-component system response regulator
MSLIGFGYEVCAVATTGEDAIKKVEESIPDLILMDIKLAGEMDGIATAKEIRSRFDIPVIYLTAHASKEYLNRAKNTEPFGYLIKPIVHKELQTNIEMALYKHSVEKQLKEKNVQLKMIMHSTIDSMAQMVEIRNPFIGKYHANVSVLSKAIAEEMGLLGDQIEGVCLAAKVHDIGMIRVPFEFFSKPSDLNESEHKIYESHSTAGYDLLKDIAFDWPIAEAVLQCHEKMDGSGYPSGLKEEDIILEARIISVASTFDCYVHGRPNMPPISKDDALEKLTQRKGIHFDSDVVDACIKVIKEKGFEFEQ